MFGAIDHNCASAKEMEEGYPLVLLTLLSRWLVLVKNYQRGSMVDVIGILPLKTH